MKLLILDEEGMGLDLAMRAERWAHDVRLWQPPLKTGERSEVGQGLTHKVDDWKGLEKWADVIFLTGNASYRHEVEGLIDGGYPVLGANHEGAQLEHDRALGQEILEACGIETAPYQTFKNMDDAIAYVKKEDRGFAIKPWGGATDKALSYVARKPHEAVQVLEDWKQRRMKGELMLQELVEGVEMGVGGWFGPRGWNRAIEENWEFKKFMNDDKGVNTGEQGTVQRFVGRSKLFNQMLKPLTEYLHDIDYNGDVSVNCIIDSKGRPWPLEFTMRAGWPAFCLQMAATAGDPATWMADLLKGKDSMEMEQGIVVGVVLTHGNYPAKTPEEASHNKPLWGTEGNEHALHFQHVKMGFGHDGAGKEMELRSMPVTAGDYILVATGIGKTVKSAADQAYSTLEEIESPTNLMYRTDIGKRLRKELPMLQEHGYAVGMEYS